MKLILKKGDSATSIIIFIFNICLMLFNQKSIKLSNLLEIFKAFGKNETAVRMALSRAVKLGLLVNENILGEIYYTLTTVGKNEIDVWNEGMSQFWKRYSMRNQPWEGKWYLVNLEYTDLNNEEKMKIIDRMKQLGFGQLRPGVWLSPYYQDNEVKNLLISLDHPLTKVTRMHGHLILDSDNDHFVQKIFKPDQLYKPYEEFLSSFTPKYEAFKQYYREIDFLDNGEALLQLHKLGWEFFQIAYEDAALPMEVFQRWIGDKAASLMNDYRQILMDSVSEYLKDLFKLKGETINGTV